MPDTAEREAARTPGAAQPHQTLRTFLLAILIPAALILGVGWFTGFRELAHGAMITVAVFAFLPFVIIAGGIGLLALLMFLYALAAVVAAFGGDAPPLDAEALDAPSAVIELGTGLAPTYYRWLASRRHPAFWGAPLGILLGGLSLWAALAAFVVPGETRTVETLAQVKAAIDQSYETDNRYPKPTPAGHLTWAALGQPDRGDVVLDGFGRPLEYRVAGAWKLASYNVKSLGYNRKPGRDDFCVSGSTKLVDGVGSLLDLAARGGKLKVTIAAKLNAIRDLRCAD